MTFARLWHLIRCRSCRRMIWEVICGRAIPMPPFIIMSTGPQMVRWSEQGDITSWGEDDFADMTPMGGKPPSVH